MQCASESRCRQNVVSKQNQLSSVSHAAVHGLGASSQWLHLDFFDLADALFVAFAGILRARCWMRSECIRSCLFSSSLFALASACSFSFASFAACFSLTAASLAAFTSSAALAL